MQGNNRQRSDPKFGHSLAFYVRFLIIAGELVVGYDQGVFSGEIGK